MTAELEQKLYKAFPKLFAQKDLPKEQTCMCWGIETPDEWFDVIYKACDTIQNYIDQTKSSQIEFTQVKEKFGSLRMYYAGADDFVDGVIEMANSLVTKKKEFSL